MELAVKVLVQSSSASTTKVEADGKLQGLGVLGLEQNPRRMFGQAARV